MKRARTIRARSPGLLPGERRRLLRRAERSPRTHLAYVLALDLGLGCRDIASLNVGDVSADGQAARAVLRLRVGDRRCKAAGTLRERTVPPEVGGEIEAHLARRRILCEHHVRPMRTITRRDGVPRCANCGEVADFVRAPLFLSRLGRRISARLLQHEFARFRGVLHLNPRLSFRSLAATYFVGRGTSGART